MNRIALISTPWPLFDRPSIQLGALKAYIKRNLPHILPDAHHIYLSIAEGLRYDLYKEISERTWLSEPLYAALLYPDRATTIERFWNKRASGLSLAKRHGFFEIYNTLKELSSQILETQDWEDYLLAGFSICFGQLTSSLYFIREIKNRAPSLKIVIGGSACAGNMGESLLRTFPEIDFVVPGEGELPLFGLIKSLEHPRYGARPDAIPGLITRHEEPGGEGLSQVHYLDSLPTPDYDDYFKQLRSLDHEKTFLPEVPMEISRGCWWRKTIGPKGTSGCAFCNLNLQWHGYRAKSAKRTVAEIDFLSAQYQILSISFIDNLLPFKGLEQLFQSINGLGKDLRLFSEIRATTPAEVLAEMGAAGMRQVQVGIESLSTCLLRKLNKGTTTIDNMEIMKNCENPALPDLTGNLILSFPSSDEQDVAETMANLEFALPLRPLKGVPFWLGYGSPVYFNTDAYGLKRVRNHPFYAQLFPPNILKGLQLMIQGYHGCIRYQNRIWRPVKKRLEEWRMTYLKLHSTPGAPPILSYQDGGDFMIIHQRRLGTLDMTHRLKGASRKIYLFCQTKRTIEQIVSKFPGLGEEKIEPFLRMMLDKRLMFNEGEAYLSLAVPG